MNMVFDIAYRVVDGGETIAAKFFEEVEAAKQEALAYVREHFGATGIKHFPRSSRVTAMLFDTKPNENFKVSPWTDYEEDEKIFDGWYGVPYKKNKESRELSRLFADTPRLIPPSEGLRRLNCDPDQFGVSRIAIHNAALRMFHIPEPIYIVVLPRTENDEFVSPDFLREIYESEHMAIYQRHNALVREMRKKEAA